MGVVSSRLRRKRLVVGFKTIIDENGVRRELPIYVGGKRKTRRAKTIRMKKGEYLREHHHLFRVLQNPTRRALNAELRAQKRELKERGLKG
jgi:hypothetical protein